MQQSRAPQTLQAKIFERLLADPQPFLHQFTLHANANANANANAKATATEPANPGASIATTPLSLLIISHPVVLREKQDRLLLHNGRFVIVEHAHDPFHLRHDPGLDVQFRRPRRRTH